MYFVDNASDIVVENFNEGTDTVQASISYTLGANVENIALTGSANINATGNSLNNFIFGNTGNNVLTGGLGNDSYLVDTVGDVVVESANQGTDMVLSYINYTLGSNLEYLALIGNANINGTGNTLDNVILGNAGINILDGGAGNDVLDGGAGNDTLIGGLGNDSYLVDSLGDIIVENIGEGSDDVQTTISGYTLAANLENLTLLGSVIQGRGNNLDNIITGNAADNIINGFGGNDTLIGGLGNDSYAVDSLGDIIVENIGEGSDKVYTYINNYTLGANLEQLILTGTIANGSGNNLDNILTGNAADNVLDGGAGNDTLIGGLGNDSYRIDSLGDVITENVGEGSDDVQTTISGYTLAANVENLTLLGSVIQGKGNNLDNIITGNAADNIINGFGGNDTLIGGLGNDNYGVDSLGDVVTENASEGTDTVFATVSGYTLAANLENLTLLGSVIQGRGNNLDNTITGNAADNVLDGGAGNDTLIGGAGQDQFLFNSVLNSSTNVDSITDFTANTDKLLLDDAIFSSLSVLGALNANNFVAGGSATAVDANDFLLYDTTSGGLYYDADGSGVQTATLFATLTNHASISANDILVV